MKASELLIAARKLIASGEHADIYVAVGCIAKWDTKALAIINQIEADLNHGSNDLGLPYTGWLKNRLGYWPTNDQAREARLQYIDALINYYQQQGD